MNARIRRIGEGALTLLQAIIPKSNIAVVYGSPTTEGNSVETASALSRRYEGRIYWFVDDEPGRWRMDGANTPVEFVRKGSLRSVVYYLRSEVVFFTHGLFGAVKPGRAQTFVNLWHGDGVKRKPTTEGSSRSLIPATYVSGGTKLLTARKAHDFKMPAGSELVFGNPRVLQFNDVIPTAFLREIGVDKTPFILWMPTFRKSSISGIGYEDKRAATLMTQIVSAARAAHLSVVVKAHRQDAESRAVAGTIAVSDELLSRHAVSLYSLIGGSAALITDYSSVWTDYLLVDRPIGFLIPDSDTYTRTRGLYPEDILDWLPGPKLESEPAIHSFIQSVVNSSGAHDQRRDTARLKLGLAESSSPADELLSELRARGCFRRGCLTDDSRAAEERPRLTYVNK